MATTTSPRLDSSQTVPGVPPDVEAASPCNTVEAEIMANPAVRALLKGSGCSVIVDRRGAYVKAYLLDASRNPLRVRRTHTAEALTDWLIETLLALPQATTARANYLAIRH